ncbi:MAG TPA: tetratricopeptide repeat protein [Methylococcaceae bacterium]|nr:tetratricopeptide repeat protein [Methylococcaceae bacterium]
MKNLHIRSGMLLAAAIMALVTGMLWHHLAPEERKDRPAEPVVETVPSPLPEPQFVGRAACIGCHAEQDRLWQGSHHDLAMQEANERTVLGNFSDAEFRKNGVVSRFFRRDGRFLVRTDGADGKLADFEVKYTFGFTPLQQYLVELPGGRLQALSIAWDSHPKEQGGQRWFHLYPNEKIDHTDELHWTKLSQNWNYMCAECHSTNLQKNYDPASRSYHTTWSEIDVACEACHGPGSQHVAFAERNPGFERIDPKTKGLAVLLDERKGIHWSIDPQSDNAHRSPPRDTEKEIQTCARCHSRRAQLFADYRYGQPLMDTHLPSLLQETLYHADGQIDGEVYEYGSILQSKMYHAGVTCSDCHEPHSLKLRVQGNGVCLQCHGAEKYDTGRHHFHRAGSAGANCVDCHMPVKNYMVVDPRRDHSFRIPRPDLSARLGTPNACTGCHAKKPARWAADKLRQWYGHDPKGYQGYAETLHASRAGAADAEARLVALLREKGQPAIARATAAAELGRWLSPDSLPALAEALADTHPRVRAAAVEALDPLPPERRWSLAHTLLRDPVRVVRALVAGGLAGIPAEKVPSGERADFRKAADDYLASQRLNADEPGAQVNLGNFHAARGESAEAEAAYREALTLSPGWVPAYTNLADLYRQMSRDAEGETLLREGLARQPKSAALHHSLGLLQVRRKDMVAALVSLKRAAELAPDDARFAYVYAVALDSTGHAREARAVVVAALKRAPGDPALNQLRSQWAAEARPR